MPEYLAPAVYVEEVDTGSKPIEGVSTSTSGMIGVTERGPVNVPTLVTSFGEYQRLFGQMLNVDLYGTDRFLPNAVEGFFTNGGKRVYVTRILDIAAAVASTRQLVAPDAAAPLQANALLSAAAGGNTVTIDVDPGFLAGDTVQIDDGLSAEFQQITGVAAAELVPLRLPLTFDHPGGVTVRLVNGGDLGAAGALQVATAAGATSITVAPVPAVIAGQVLRVGPVAAADDEELVVAAGPAVGNVITLRTPLQYAHPAATTPVQQIDETALAATSTVPAGVGVAPGSAVVPVVASAGLTTAGDTVEIQHPTAAQFEYRRIGALQRVDIEPPAYAHYPAGSRFERVALPAAGAPVGIADHTAEIGDTVIAVSNRTGMVLGGLLLIGGAQPDLVTVVGLPAPLPAPNPGNVVVGAPLRFQHVVGTSVAPMGPVTAAPTEQGVITLDAPIGTTPLAISRAVPAGADVLRVTPLTGGGPYYHTVTAASAAYAPQMLTLLNPLTLAHLAGVMVARRTPMIAVRALDAGVWGNRLRVAMEQQASPLLTTRVRQLLPGGKLRLDSASGIETGTELSLTDGSSTVTPLKVLSIDRQNDSLITLEATTPLPGLAAVGDWVRSREYRFVVELLRQPDPSNPARDTIAIDREVFANLSLDRRHSRYFETVIGCTWNMSSAATITDDRGRVLRRTDRRSEGESWYVRVFDVGFATSTGFRPGPLATYDLRPGSTPRLVLLPLANGNDVLAAVNELTYIGSDHINPEQRTGLFTLRNIEEISIVAAPGRTGVALQSALINHCELMRYRFAVLDGQAPPVDSIPDIQTQRQQFDTKYAALYHPWLLVADPFPVNGTVRQDYPIPPSGHMVGIYARTDIERGVHKAPANEVVRGVVGLQRVLNKEQHDILNPYPVNVNVIRDFRPNNRGIRVYGGRVITSDSDWKYVNVRRLLIFIEASIDRGLQWVVFEPNAEPLWARVRRSISNFLTLVWRNGALEGTKPEEAYFVKCDRTTMTQTDIDQGRLICLVGVAPVKPAEFVIVRIGLWTAHAED
jgi:phage tail sheath protein FI